MWGSLHIALVLEHTRCFIILDDVRTTIIVRNKEAAFEKNAGESGNPRESWWGIPTERPSMMSLEE